MRSMMLTLGLCLSTALPASAQGDPVMPSVPRGRACDMRFKMLMLRVQDAAGAPVVGAVMTLRRKGRPEVLRTDSTSGTGNVNYADDALLPRVPERGADFVVSLHKGETMREVTVRLAHGPGGCHVDKRSGPTVVTF